MEAGRILLMKYQFLLQAARKTFNRGVVATIALAAHATGQTVFSQQFLKVAAGVLCAIRMKASRRTDESICKVCWGGFQDLWLPSTLNVCCRLSNEPRRS